MANSWFHFQQFTVEQGRSAMKVCTDACLFGAWVQTAGPVRMLDVGCGTGLLSLMGAQKNPVAQIDALEPHSGSFQDARFNVDQSRWKDRIQVHHTTFQDWIKNQSACYDAVICNPPFFLNHLQSPDIGRNEALHMEETEWPEWIKTLPRFLKPEGRMWLILSADAWVKTESSIRYEGLYPIDIEMILQKNGKPFRVLVCLSFTQGLAKVKTKNLYGSDGKLSDWASGLVKPFYLDKTTDS